MNTAEEQKQQLKGAIDLAKSMLYRDSLNPQKPALTENGRERLEVFLELAELTLEKL